MEPPYSLMGKTSINQPHKLIISNKCHAGEAHSVFSKYSLIWEGWGSLPWKYDTWSMDKQTEQSLRGQEKNCACRPWGREMCDFS